jgi:hypothetical protein
MSFHRLKAAGKEEREKDADQDQVTEKQPDAEVKGLRPALEVRSE